MKSSTYLKVVPWFSMSEWKTVYGLVYSSDAREQKDGLDRLVCWKARCPSLPSAVECTLAIFHVLLEDPEHLWGKSISATREQQLRLMYPTAVMRFLNLMVEVKNEEEKSFTLYAKAEKLGIPEWIVNLRHDAAHGTSLPDLSLLRAAAVFISKWLHEHYWEHESELIRDWHNTEEDIIALSSDENNLTLIMEAWEALSLYQLAGFENMRQIPDNELMASIKSINKMLREENESKIKLKHHAKVSTVLSLVLKKLTRFLKERTGKLDKTSLLAETLVGGDFLLPAENLMEILYPSGFDSHGVLQQLPMPLVDSCEDLMSVLWDLDAIPALAKKLLSTLSNRTETDMRRNMAALWAQKIFLSCLKIREVRRVRSAIREHLDCKTIFDQYSNFLPEANRNTVITSLAFSAVENQRSELKLGYAWKVSPIPKALTDVHLLKQSVLLPSKFSLIFMPSLMELIVPAISPEAKRLTLNLIEIYSQKGQGFQDVEKGPFSVCDLPSYSPRLNNKKYVNNLSSSSLDDNVKLMSVSNWSLSQGHLEWQKCPVGTLPWLREQCNVDQEEYENKNKHRTWSKLIIQSEWSSTSQETEDMSRDDAEFENLHSVKAGRVTKPFMLQASLAKSLKAVRQSPKLKALKFLVGTD